MNKLCFYLLGVIFSVSKRKGLEFIGNGSVQIILLMGFCIAANQSRLKQAKSETEKVKRCVFVCVYSYVYISVNYFMSTVSKFQH